MKKLNKALSLSLTAAMMLTMLVGCGSSGEPAGTDAPSGSADTTSVKDILTEPVKIAMIPMSTAGQTNLLVENAKNDFLAAYNNNNVTVDMFDASYDATTQISIIEDCIAQGYECMIVEPMDSVAVGTAITEAEAAGIPIITNDLGCEAIHTVHMQGNDYAAGQQGGEYIDNALNHSGNVVLLDCPAALKSSTRMGTGFEDYVSEKTDLVMLAAEPVENMSQEIANTTMANLLTKYGDQIDAVYCCTDDVAQGALQACQAAGYDDILIWGLDAYPATVTAIENGDVYGTSWGDKYTKTIAELNMAMFLISAGINSVSMGFDSTPVIDFAQFAVTSENVGTMKALTRWPADMF